MERTAEIVSRTGRTIVFTRTRRGADRLAKKLTALGVNAGRMHGGRTQSQRQAALNFGLNFFGGRNRRVPKFMKIARGGM